MYLKPRWLFALGAAWNIVIGLSVLLAPLSSLGLLYGHEPSADDQLLSMLNRDFAYCVLIFGLGYGIVAIDPSQNHGLIWLGIIGKLGVVAVLGQRWLTEVATAWVLPAAAGDLAFAVLFACFLWRSNPTHS
jgi:hypothetical protein